MIGSLFSGYGGLDMAAEALGFGPTAWHCEIEPAPAKVLAHRWPGVPNLGDITAVDWTQVEPVDVITGGFPCQDISNAGKRAGIEGARSGLWSFYADAVRVLRPHLVFVENVGALLGRGMGRVLGDLAALGYDARWVSVRASDAGAPHRRERIFIVATDARRGELQRRGGSGRLGSAADRNKGSDGQRERLWDTPSRRGAYVATHATRDGRLEGWAEPARLVGRFDATDCRPPACHVRRSWLTSDGYDYTEAVRRWHALTRCVPAPAIRLAHGDRINPLFSEWMMGLPTGHVTDVPGLTRNEQLKMLGNGVVPQQAVLAYTALLSQERAA